MMLFMAAGASTMWYVNDKFAAFNTLSPPPVAANGQPAPAQMVLNQVEERGEITVPLREVRQSPAGSITVLLMGVDAREDEEIDIGVRADSLFVLHMDSNDHTCRTLSIPRDTRVELPGYGQSKINHALSVGGVPYQILVVEQFLGIEVDHFGLIDFAGLVGVVDQIGGVTITNKHEFTYQGITFPEGEQTLNGKEALAYSRYRYDREGDFGRQVRQQQVVKAVLEQTGSMDATRLIPNTLENIEGHFKTDLKPTSLISIANDFRSTCSFSALEASRLDGSIGNDWDELEEMQLSFVHVQNTEVSGKVGWLLNESSAWQPMPVIAREGPERRTPAGGPMVLVA
jgi:LCP family protein required for cell wall assembly